ncbi:unnamed protein product [Porites evermanni]|uniref:Protein kinase domain-containing protein n=1 Tax=Porites evermanni TaxID=104178 RepID=A0ABN8MVC7_9CNID|nr:unnamed protein product [Porites evermanni]
MHNVFTGTAKHVMKNVWLDVEKPVLDKKDLEKVQDKMDKLKVLASVGRMPKKIENSYGGFTADQWKSFTVLFSIYALWDILPRNDLELWRDFVMACSYLCCPVITEMKALSAHSYLLKFSVIIRARPFVSRCYPVYSLLSIGPVRTSAEIANSVLMYTCCGPCSRDTIDPDVLPHLKKRYKTIFDKLDETSVTCHFQRCACCKFNGDLFGSQMSRGDRSAFVLVSWCKLGGAIDTSGSDLRAGVIDYFINQNVSVNGHYETCILAGVRWFQEHPSRHSLGAPVEVWCKDLFEREWDATFIPVQRIHGKFIPAIDLINGEHVLVVCPLARKLQFCLDKMFILAGPCPFTVQYLSVLQTTKYYLKWKENKDLLFRENGGNLPSASRFGTRTKNFSLIGTDIITNFPAIEWHHLNASKDKEGNEKLIQLGEGVFGQCVKKYYKGIPVAVEVLNHFSSLQDVRNEAYTMAQCSHPSIPHLFGVNVTKKPYFIVSYFYHLYNNSCTLYRALQSKSMSLSQCSAGSIVLKLCEAIEHLHSKRFLHRDI